MTFLEDFIYNNAEHFFNLLSTIIEIYHSMQEVSVEVEAELLSAAHTNVLLLQQVFAQAQKWHLDLDADLAELENRCAI